MDPEETAHVASDASTEWEAQAYTLAAAAFVIFIILYWSKRDIAPPGFKLPPGPRGLPLVGHVPFVTMEFSHNQFRKWSTTYGSILKIKVGATYVVVLNDLDSIKEVLCKNEVLNRSENVILHVLGVTGVGTLNGKLWQDNRRFCLHVLRDLGFGRKSMEEHIKEESLYLTEKIAETKGSPIAVQEYLVPSMSNNISALVFGSRYLFDDPKRKFLDEQLGNALRILGSSIFVNFLPGWLNTLALRIPFFTISSFGNIFRELSAFVSKEVQEHIETIDKHSNRDFIDGYIKKIKEHENDPDSSFKTRFLFGNVLNFFGAGSNTVMVTIMWHLLTYANYPDTVQAKIQREIDEVVGRERQPKWEDRNRMPFTMATIWEVYRWRTIAPLGIPRAASEDVFFGEYFIPKGCMVLANLWTVHMDPKLWKDPENFDPSRFLTKDGTELGPKPESLMPFSVGKRMCPGETLATVEVFLNITTLLQKFNVLPEEGQAIDLSTKGAAITIPQAQKLRFIPR